MTQNDQVYWLVDGEKMQDLDAVKLGGCHIFGVTRYSIYSCMKPLSPLEYRRKRPTKAKITIAERCDGATIIILDDYGNPCHISMIGIAPAWIEALKNSARAHNLLCG